MTTDSLFEVFDAWEPLFKARKPKGLDKWDRLKNLSQKLQGKDSKAISFTCAHPSHSTPCKHLLGSVEGNLHFLLGYGNPAFYLAPYHWQIIDPNVTDEQAEEMAKRMSHPSNPGLWTGESELEGDTKEGKPHPDYKKSVDKAKFEESRSKEAIKVSAPVGSYTCYPSEQVVYGDHNGHGYAWDIVKDTYFTAQNPEATQAMNAGEVVKSQLGITYKQSIPVELSSRANRFFNQDFDVDVWPLVKSRVAHPGKIISTETAQGETLYALVTNKSLEFYKRDGQPATINVFDRAYTHFDLTKSGNIPPASLLKFVTSQFNIDTSLLSEVAQAADPLLKSNDWYIDGEPSAGWDDVGAEPTDIEKSVIVEGDLMKVVHV